MYSTVHLHGLLLRLDDEVVVAEDAGPHQVPQLLALLTQLLALVELGLRLKASWVGDNMWLA